DNPIAPRLSRFAHQFGLATKFYAVTHPSQPNYIALLGGSTFGITDDDAFYCSSGNLDRNCPHSKNPGYPNHTISARTLLDQLKERGLTWKGYFESIPAPGSKTAYSAETADEPADLYASKHNGLMALVSVQKDERVAEHIVGFDRLELDLKTGN